MPNKNDLIPPPPYADLATRLAFCARRVGGKRALAEASGFSESQLFRYISGTSEMSAAKAQALAGAARVNLDWLLSGSGQAEKPILAHLQPAFRPALMEDLLRILNEIFVDFEWRLNPTQRAKYATYAYMAMRLEKQATGHPTQPTSERLTEGLWYFGKSTFDELINIHLSVLSKKSTGQPVEAWELAHYAQAIQQGHYQFYNSTGGDAVNRWLGLQVSESSAQRLLKLLETWRRSNPVNRKWLDIGCGNGRELEYLKRHEPTLEVYGADIARAALDQCHKFARSGLWPQESVVEADATQLPFATGSMGMVYTRGLLAYLPYFGEVSQDYGLTRALAEINRVASPGALITLVLPLHRTNYFTYSSHINVEVLNHLCRLFPWKIINLQTFELPYGSPGYRDQAEILIQKNPA